MSTLIEPPVEHTEKNLEEVETVTIRLTPFGEVNVYCFNASQWPLGFRSGLTVIELRRGIS